jgi:hypothetical protein
MAMASTKETQPMSPRPLIKWKSFWLGILVLVFLGWAWVRSIGHADSVWAGVRSSEWLLTSFAGRMTWLCHDEAFRGEARSIHGLGFDSGRGGDNEEWIQPAFEKFQRDVPYGNGTLSFWRVSHWFLILLFFLPWSAFRAWRYRRQRKLTETNPSTP